MEVKHYFWLVRIWFRETGTCKFPVKLGIVSSFTRDCSVAVRGESQSGVLLCEVHATGVFTVKAKRHMCVLIDWLAERLWSIWTTSYYSQTKYYKPWHRYIVEAILIGKTWIKLFALIGALTQACYIHHTIRRASNKEQLLHLPPSISLIFPVTTASAA